MEIRAILGVGSEFRYDVISKEDWFGRRLIATRFRSDRIFIAGDAAHIWVPYAGFGMNAGIADAANLAWLLASRVKGWGGAAMLDAYEAERMPITEQVSRFAMSHAEKEIKRRGAVPVEIEDVSEAGQRARAAVGRLTYEINVQQYAAAGLNFGSYYDCSPIIVYDDEAAPAYTMADFTPSTVPGCRVPHFWLADDRSLFDALGMGYTVLRLNSDVSVETLIGAAERRGMPLAVLDVAGIAKPEAYRHALVIVRPDQHVAWRGDRLPDEPHGLIATLAGWH